MGMYTELNYNVALKEDVPKQVIDTLNYMLTTGDDVMSEPILPDHPLFSTSRWRVMLRMDSYYFDADTKSTLRKDEHMGQYYLNIQCNLKNYDGEIGKFLDWIRPYIDACPGQFLGHSRYEEFQEPTLIFA